MNIKNLFSLKHLGLQQKATLFIILPTFLILVGMGLIGLRLVRNTLLEQWQETAMSKLQRTAHTVDMRLMRPKELLLFLQEDSATEINRQTYDIIIKQLLSLDGVVQVSHEWYGPNQNGVDNVRMMQNKRGLMRYHHLERLEISTPKYDTKFKNETVTLATYFKDNNDKRLGHIEVVISFYDLIDQVVEAPWWQSNKAFIVGPEGDILTSTLSFDDLELKDTARKFGEEDLLEKKTLSAMQTRESGTIFGQGMPPDEISGFHKLSQAPWTMVVIAPGKKVLEPIITFRNLYFIIGSIGIILALLLIRIATNKTTKAIAKVSRAANDLASGNFGSPIETAGEDEVGDLTRNFNKMSQQLRKGFMLQEAMNIAREVQQNLLPKESYSTDDLEFGGLSIYCDETGGDYYDVIPSQDNPGQLSVVVGDVVGHGIGAALLMATVRALIRSRVAQAGSLSEIICDVNKLLCLDTVQSGNFVTLFFLVVDRDARTLRWIRCGHEPAIVLDSTTGEFSEIRGDGLALGFEASWCYEESHLKLDHGEKLILVGSDGVWDVENAAGESFGKERVKAIMQKHCSLSPNGILQKITTEIELFRDNHPQNDDITLALVKLH